MAQSVLKRKTGVIVGDDVLHLFNYAQEHKFAIPAIVRVLDKKAINCPSLLTIPECHVLLYCRGSSRSCSGQEGPHNLANVAGRGRLLRWKGKSALR